ncbi:serine hydrolase domain-containing protein [Leucobacter alluvii]|uniref:serine hydrolase domain-containing protein n=1 Tax=Leucobacter alluvii TaxID=340321 RepID=UPI0031F88F6C
MSTRARWGLSAVLLSGLLVAGCAPLAADAKHGEDAPHASGDAETFASAVDAALAGSGVPGGAIVVTGSDGGNAFEYAFGRAAEGRDVTLQTPFAYRSMTKSFVGTVVLQLADEGVLSLSDPVSLYVDGVPNGDEITIEQLGTMRSGVANYSGSPRLTDLLVVDPAREPAVTELLDLAFPDSPEFAPGAAYEYSNTNTLLLGEIITSATGRPWYDEVDDRLLAALDLDSVTDGLSDSDRDAAGYQLADGAVVEELPWVAPGWFGAAGALAGDVGDLAVWGRALGTGAELAADTQQWRLDSFGATDDDARSPEYDAYGFAIGEIDGWVGHTGNGLGFQGLVMHDPDSGRTVALLINGTGEDPDLPAHVFTEILPVIDDAP